MEILLPLFMNMLLALGLALCVFLFLTLKQDAWKKNKLAAEERAYLRVQACRLDAELAALKQSLAELENQLDELPRYSPPMSSINTTRRSQVLRMHRRGERPEQIATALGIPQGEVDLLLKLHDAATAA